MWCLEVSAYTKISTSYSLLYHTFFAMDFGQQMDAGITTPIKHGQNDSSPTTDGSCLTSGRISSIGRRRCTACLHIHTPGSCLFICCLQYIHYHNIRSTTIICTHTYYIWRHLTISNRRVFLKVAAEKAWCNQCIYYLSWVWLVGCSRVWCCWCCISIRRYLKAQQLHNYYWLKVA